MRDEILSTTPAHIRGFSQIIADCTADKIYCTVGSEGAINANKDIFGKIERL
jgi:hypothetical protein